MAASAPATAHLLATPLQLGYTDATDAQVVEAINELLAKEFDGQCLRIDRTPKGNLGDALCGVCISDKVVIPDPIRMARILRVAVGGAWTVYIKSGTFLFELYPKPEQPLPDALL